MAIGAAVGLTAVSAIAGDRASRRATRAQTNASNAAISEQQAAREDFNQRVQPFADFGASAIDPLRELLGFDGGNQLSQLEEINPIVSFLRDEGFEEIQESAAAGGRLGAVGTLNDLTQRNIDISATVAPQLQQQRFNQLFNVLTSGSNAATGQGTTSLNTASNVGNLLLNRGNAQANGINARNDNLQNALGNLASIGGAFPSIFGSSGTPALNRTLSTGGVVPNGTVSPVGGF